MLREWILTVSVKARCRISCSVRVWIGLDGRCWVVDRVWGALGLVDRMVSCRFRNDDQSTHTPNTQHTKPPTVCVGAQLEALVPHKQIAPGVLGVLLVGWVHRRTRVK